MYHIKEYLIPESVEEACHVLSSDPRNHVALGCGCWLRLGERRIAKAVDLSRLELNKIEEEAGWLVLGSGVTLRQLEIHPAVTARFSGMLGAAVSSIVGVQFRNMATVGGSICGRFGFSDVITALLSLDARVVFHRAGEMPLEQFLTSDGCPGDILTQVRIPDDGRQAAYESVRRSSTDFPVLTAAVSRTGEEWRISVGARPFVAMRSREAERCLKDGRGAAAAGAAAAEELRFGGNLRASEEYRRQIASVLVRRAAQRLEEEPG